MARTPQAPELSPPPPRCVRIMNLSICNGIYKPAPNRPAGFSSANRSIAILYCYSNYENYGMQTVEMGPKAHGHPACMLSPLWKYSITRGGKPIRLCNIQLPNIGITNIRIIGRTIATRMRNMAVCRNTPSTKARAMATTMPVWLRISSDASGFRLPFPFRSWPFPR